ncbi:MAG TPA: HIT family protein [Candidatus Thermoplasmatota archaeon]|nr:HIT family protein [Candidatus Thermoplasmatota archaeon]
MAACIFCAIANGDVPSANLFEDGRVFAFLDINPLAPGHTLIVPKRHAAKVEECDGKDLAALLETAKRLLPILCRETGHPDATLAFNNGPGAGQEVAHVHLHLVPRKKGDGHGPIHALFPDRRKADTEELHDLAVRVQKALEGGR